MKSYIVASSKPWHRTGYEVFVSKRCNEKWFFVDSKRGLADAVGSLNPRYIFFLHWNWRVESTLTDSVECVCFHMTDLPYGRGGSPLQNLVQRGIKDTKLCALRMVSELDAGPIYCRRDMSLAGRAEEIYLRASSICWEIIDWMLASEPVPVPQAGQVTFFSRRNPQQSRIPEGLSFLELYDFLRMLDAPTYPLAFIEFDNKIIEFHNVEKSGDEILANVRIRCK